MKDLLNLVENRQWLQIPQKYQPTEVAKSFSFQEGMLLGYHLLLNDQMDDDARDYAVQLINEIRKLYPKEWNSDWKNDVFLGDAFYLIMQYENCCEAYKHSFDKVSPKPHPLLVSMAGCYTLPNSSITIEDAERWIQEALKQEQSVEAVTLIRGICKSKGDIIQFTYWDNILQQLQKKKAYMKHKWPDFIENASIHT